MKLIEVIILTGVHCASPVQHSTQATEAGKVWCAVIVEADSVTKSAEVSPPGEARNPLVVAALKRLDATLETPAGAEPPPVDLDAIAAQVAAGPGSSITVAPENADEVSRLAAMPPEPQPEAEPSEPASAAQATLQGEPQPASSQPEMPEPGAVTPETVPAGETSAQPSETETVTAAEKPPEAKTKTRTASTKKKKKVTTKRRTDVCGKTTRAVWYTNKDGKRKYRCRKPGDGRLY